MLRSAPSAVRSLRDLEQTRAALRQDLNYAGAPPELRARIMCSFDQETAIKSPRVDGGWLRGWRPQPFWRGAFSGIGGTAIAAGIAFFALTPALTNPLLDDLVSAHARSLMPDHLIDVVSTDKHTVKRWFAGHTDGSRVWPISTAKAIG